jgi:hypothetical protein
MIPSCWVLARSVPLECVASPAMGADTSHLYRSRHCFRPQLRSTRPFRSSVLEIRSRWTCSSSVLLTPTSRVCDVCRGTPEVRSTTTPDSTPRDPRMLSSLLPSLVLSWRARSDWRLSSEFEDQEVSLDRLDYHVCGYADGMCHYALQVCECRRSTETSLPDQPTCFPSLPFPSTNRTPSSSRSKILLRHRL